MPQPQIETTPDEKKRKRNEKQREYRKKKKLANEHKTITVDDIPFQNEQNDAPIQNSASDLNIILEEEKRKQNERQREYRRKKKIAIGNKNTIIDILPLQNEQIINPRVKNSVSILSGSQQNLNYTGIDVIVQPTSNNNNLLNNISIPQSNNNKLTITEQTNEMRIGELEVKIFRELDVHYIGKMDVNCCHCGAKHFTAEKVTTKGKNSFNDCCGHGEVTLEDIIMPKELEELFNTNHPKFNHFIDNIRKYNTNNSFASFNANLYQFRGRPGPFCFKIQSQIYYQINTALQPGPNENASFGQLFFIDQNEAIEQRIQSYSNVDPEIVELLDNLIRKNNAFAIAYNRMREEIEIQKKDNPNNDDIPELQLMLSLKFGKDERRYNTQRINEVAAIFKTTADGEIPDSYVVIRNKTDKKLQKVSIMDPNVEPWIYPLFYPYGQQGWHKKLLRKNGKKNITRSDYAKYRIAIRDTTFNAFLRGGRLFQQWVVDNYVRIEKDRIDYCAREQKKLRVDSYTGLIDHIQKKANNLNAQVGKIVILPSTFIGSPRNMMQSYQDSMAIVRKYGKPHYFITMTCNANWPEIKENLLPGQSSSDRPDIVARVFEIKKNALMDEIIKKEIFGLVEAHVHVIEFQKRGLPHMHMLVTLKQDPSLADPTIIDTHICAEIPNPEKFPKIHKLVMKHMIHGPCGDWCLVKDKCSKHFPKPYREITTIDGNNYPQYRRRNNGLKYMRPGGFEVDNQYVVPYSPKLLMIFDCHINVEKIHDVSSVKYLHKYIYKGHDCASAEISQNTDDIPVINHDEIKEFIDSRYVGPVEAVHRILQKPLQGRSHFVISLPVHLPNEQCVIVDTDAIGENNVESALEALANKSSMLLEFFALNIRDPFAREYLYMDIPQYYVFKKIKIDGKTVSRWERRKNKFNTIGRMYAVSPSQQELFHLRILLLNIKNMTSFNDLKTVNGKFHDTFTSTCLARGLIEDDDEWRKAMNEAISWMMPKRLRRLFVRILIHCQPLHPDELWTEFKKSMSEDFAQHEHSTQAENRAYMEINEMLQQEGWAIKDFPSMEPLSEIPNQINVDPTEIDLSLNIGTSQYKKLNEQQKEIVDKILNIIENTSNNFNNKKCFYIDGPGGSGKTFIYSTLWHILNSKKKKVKTMAFTGIAAILLPKGKTVHKTFGLPVPLLANSSSNIKLQSKQAQDLRETDIFIWDEAPMAPRYALEIINRTLQDITENNQPFGGKIFVLGGDFKQLLPVKPNGTKDEIINLSIKFSDVWKQFEIFHLNQNMRTLPEEQNFANFLIEMGTGNLNDKDDKILIPEECILQPGIPISKAIYQDLVDKKNFKEASRCAILSARNVDVDQINQEVINMLDKNTQRVYPSINSTEHCNDNDKINENIQPEYLNTLTPSSLPPHELRLRKYCILMLIRNMSSDEGLCNGTRLLLLEMKNYILKCEILTGDKTGEIIFLHRMTLYCENEYPFTFKRIQFPVKPAFAMTINKAQGQTFEKIGIDLKRDVFSHGQLYVAFSRVRAWSSIKIQLGNNYQPNDLKKIKNCVYKEILFS